MDGGRRRAAVDRLLVVLWLLATVVCVGCTVTLALALYHASPGTPVELSSLRGLENRLALTFPPGTELVEAKYIGSLIQILEAKVRMPRAEVEPWLRKPPFEGEPNHEGNLIGFFNNDCGMTDWHPEPASEFWSAVAREHPHERPGHAYVLVHLDDPKMVDVYVYWNIS